MHYLLRYETAPDYLTRRPQFRALHLKAAWEAVERGELVLAGAVGEPPTGALLLFRCDSPDVPSSFARTDPYVLNGLITRWSVEPWSTVVGADASNPVRDV